MAAVAGRTYSFTLSGDGSADALGSKELVLRDAQGNQIDYDYTYGTGVVTITWKATSSGPVFLDAHGNSSTSWGNYRLSVVSDAPLLTGTAGNGLVTVTGNGTGDITAVAISRDVVDPDDIETLQDLVIGALADLAARRDALVSEKMGPLAGGLPGLG